MKKRSNKKDCLSSRGGECKFIKKDGSKCRALAIKNSDFCFFHANIEKLRLAGKKGGTQGRRRVLEESNLTLRSVDDVVSLLETTINEVRCGDLDQRIGNTIGYLAGILLKSLEQSDFDKRLSDLENTISQRMVG